MKFNSFVEVKTPWYFLENYSMISTDAHQVGFLSLLTIVNEGVSLTIVNETTNFIKTIILKTNFLKNDCFKNDRFVFDFSSSFS